MLQSITFTLKIMYNITKPNTLFLVYLTIDITLFLMYNVSIRLIQQTKEDTAMTESMRTRVKKAVKESDGALTIEFAKTAAICGAGRPVVR